MTVELPDTADDDIRSSWERSWLSGVRPDLSLERLDAVEIDRQSRLLQAALPVLDRVADALAETSYFTVLADNAARIVHRGRITHRTEDVLDHTGVVLGRQFTEDSTGTNAIAAPFELRRGVAVHGNEHFAQSLRVYSCYGCPIINPVTRRLEGVLDLAGRAGEENPLFGPFLRQAVVDIERALLADSRDAGRRLLHAFDAAASRRGDRALLALGTDGEVVVANRTALDHLDADDHSRLQELADPVRRSGLRREVRFGTARGLDLQLTFDATDGHVLISFRPVYLRRRSSEAPSHPVDPVARELERCRDHRLATVVAGDPGTGRSHTAHRLAGPAPAVTLSGADVHLRGRAGWLDDVRRAATGEGLAVIEDFDLLDDHLLRAIGERIANGAWIALTGPPMDVLGPEHRYLAFRCLGRIELSPLRERRPEIPALARQMLTEATGGSARFTPPALARLAELDWPGNLRELHHVVRTVAGRRSAGDILLADLPAEYRTGPELAGLSPWDRSEHDAIVAALKRNHGNKVAAARDLGISRGTLYNRLRSLRIAT
ncbi:sigma-54-dependent Fis family transcriptional regulator [Amycolatopsis jejuensis]|uniref:sigma-54-dependent Fis family transcriptional regulator n=1 Tax=Amycolatopsis jejuensis TaxID=330084 RepID=UPI00052602F7|nr:helix-turn-helix domain-containing protein [Amycolatopsis jejuensis]